MAHRRCPTRDFGQGIYFLPKEKSPKKTTLNFEQQNEFKKIEKEIKIIETKKEEIQNRFTSESLDPKEIEEYSIKLGVLDKELEQKTSRWFELSEN